MRRHRPRRLLALAGLAGLAAASLVPLTGGSAAAATTTPRLVAVRAAHQPGFDRVVFEFRNGLPSSRTASYVTTLVGDASGLPVRIAGRAILQIRFGGADAHNSLGQSTAPSRATYNLPNVMTVVRSGDFEAVTTYGIGLMSRQPYKVWTLRSPSRVVVDIGAAYPTVTRKVWMFNSARYLANTEPFFTPVNRQVLAGLPATTLMHRLYAGPTATEYANGLRLRLSGTTGFNYLTVVSGIAKVRLTGACSSGGSTVTIAGQILPTLKQLAGVRAVKIYDARSTTGTPFGFTDSIPACLEP